MPIVLIFMLNAPVFIKWFGNKLHFGTFDAV